MAMLTIDTDYLREEAGVIETAKGTIDEAISGLKSAGRSSGLFAFSSEQRAINEALEKTIKELEELNGGLEAMRLALLDGAAQVDGEVADYQPQLNERTTDIKVANGYKPSGSSFGNPSGADSNINTKPAIPIINIPSIFERIGERIGQIGKIFSNDNGPSAELFQKVIRSVSEAINGLLRV